MGRDMGLLMPSCDGLQSRMALTGMVCALGVECYIASEGLES